MRIFVSVVAIAFLMAAVLWVSTPATAATVLLEENFDSVTLGPNVDEALEEAQAWTDTPPAGWTVDDSGIPGGGVTEWSGWSFTNKDWWATTAGDQDRTQFVLGQNVVAVADPDEWEDAAHDDLEAAGWYDAYMSTPDISLTNVVAGSVTLTFDSSWRDEFDDNYHQTANITVSYDGGAEIEVLLWESDGASANFKDDTTNETVTIALDNPAGASSMMLTFGLFEAGNDWWWAIDNVLVEGEVSAATAVDAQGKLATSWATLKR